jgi:hypothetical protein
MPLNVSYRAGLAGHRPKSLAHLVTSSGIEWSSGDRRMGSAMDGLQKWKGTTTVSELAAVARGSYGRNRRGSPLESTWVALEHRPRREC